MKLVVRVNAKVVQDHTGAYSQLPVLIDEIGGIVMPLLDYTLKLKRDGLSQSSINSLIKSTQLLLEYIAVNKSGFRNPQSLFEVFSSRLYTGTIDDSGYDPSGLYWLPLSKQTVRQYIWSLSNLTDWMAEHHGAVSMNPMVEADSFTKKLNYAAWFRKNQNDFLGHVKDRHINKTVRYARNVKGMRPLGKQKIEAIEFPERHFEDFYFNGIGGAKDIRVAIRDKLILLLMHFGGLRESEALHLWLQDVFVDPDNSQSVKIRIYHPEDGVAPDTWKGRTGMRTRAAYLREKYALSPRTDLYNSQRVGWKARVSDSKDAYLDVHWFPRQCGEVFSALWRDYTRLLTTVDRSHPYAFTSFNKSTAGQPYRLSAFNFNYAQGLKRIGLKRCKSDGLSPHSHRHSYGRRLRRAGVQEVVIKKCLHHASIASQEVYTAPTAMEVTESLELATEQLKHLENKTEQQGSPSWDVLTQHGFNDIDPDGFFTGKYSKLRK